jgi:uncharacterized protein YjbI with pentapeptide repeats
MGSHRMASNRQQIIQRWKWPEWQRINAYVLNAFTSNKPLAESSILSYHEGRLDLRGIDISQEILREVHQATVGDGIRVDLQTGPITIIKSYNFKNVDFSYANFNGVHLEKCTFENVLFTHATGRDVRDRSCIFKDVDLSYANWRGATVGLDGARYEFVKFIGTDLRDIHCYRGYFIDCDFSLAKLHHIDFNASHFIRCKFKGKLTRVWFRGYYDIPAHEEAYGTTEQNPMLGVDFSEAQLWDVMFTTNCDLTYVTPPQDGNHHLFKNWECIISKAHEEVERYWSNELKKQAVLLLGIFGSRKNNMHILNKYFIEYLVAMGIKNRQQQIEFREKFWQLLLSLDQVC